MLVDVFHGDKGSLLCLKSLQDWGVVKLQDKWNLLCSCRLTCREYKTKEWRFNVGNNESVCVCAPVCVCVGGATPIWRALRCLHLFAAHLCVSIDATQMFQHRATLRPTVSLYYWTRESFSSCEWYIPNRHQTSGIYNCNTDVGAICQFGSRIFGLLCSYLHLNWKVKKSFCHSAIFNMTF